MIVSGMIWVPQESVAKLSKCAAEEKEEIMSKIVLVEVFAEERNNVLKQTGETSTRFTYFRPTIYANRPNLE
jgi:hypothetical protein